MLLKALIYGSIAGSIVGSLLRYLYDHSDVKTMFSLQIVGAVVTSVLLACVLVIAFARKKHVKPFITIEDFWGGFFVGFVAGYVGRPMIQSIVPGVGP